jgi:DNA-binding CsgD family transcriptional regulator
MVARLEEFISTSSTCRSEAQLLNLYLRTVEDEGYQNAVFAKATGQRLTAIPWAHLPDGYSHSYISNHWDKIDPIVHHIHSARRPFMWSDACAKMNLSGRQKAFLEDCRDLGVHSGITIPLHGPGSEVDLISLSLRDEKRVEPGRIPLLHALTVQYRSRLGELQGDPAEAVKPLTLKEMECLRWCKEGKTNWEIGEIMSISEKTVEFHLSNTIKKLDVSNRITAVVKGIQLGIISI